MAENSKIEWTDHTFNPWEGCQKVGPGCDHCYAETRNARYAGGVAVNWGPGAPRRRTSTANWRKPLTWEAAHAAFFAAHGRRQRVFCASLADVFDNEVPAAWRADLFDMIWNTPHLDWLLLTKRIGNAKPLIERALQLAGRGINAPWPWSNVWIGATIVNQAEADRDIPKLLAMPAARRFLSMEPLLGPVNLEHVGRYTNGSTNWNALRGIKTTGILAMSPSEGSSMVSSDFGNPRIDWVIVGGESGPSARPMSPGWVQSLRDQCRTAGVPFLFKQWGEWAPGTEHPPSLSALRAPDAVEFVETDGHGHQRRGPAVIRIGKKAAGRLLDGREWNEVPA